ncbi:MAG: hypothetical protein LRZ94_00825 [Candidatus Pacebacteria bacterium]|nr:hypothetical protein [Candidatus Paceibacterota bacterium]
MAFTPEELEKLREIQTLHTSPHPRNEVGVFTPQHGRAIREPEGTLMKALDFITRPTYASASFSKAIVEGKGIREALRASYRGLRGKERVFYSDVLESAGVKNKYVRSIAGFALDVGLDPLTYMTFGKSAGAKLGSTVLNKKGRLLKKAALKKNLSMFTKKHLKAGVVDKKMARKLAVDEIEEMVLRTALKNPDEYVDKTAVRIFGKKIPVVSDILYQTGKMTGKAWGKFTRRQPFRWAGEAFIGDDFIMKKAKKLTPLQKNLAVLYRQQANERILLGGQLAMTKTKEMAKAVPRLVDRELISRSIEQAAKKKVPLSTLLPKHLVGKAEDVQKFIFKEITEPEAQRGLLKTFRLGYIPHYYPKRLAGMLGRDVPHPIVARNRAGKSRIFETMDEAIKAGWQPIEDFAVAVGIRNAYSKKVIAVDDYVQKMLSLTGTPMDKKSFNKAMKLGRLPEGMGLYLPRGGARFYPLYNSKKTKVVQMGNERAMKKLFETQGEAFLDRTVMKLRPNTIKTTFKISDDVPVYLMPDEVADVMNAMSPYLTRDVIQKGLIRHIDSVTNFWKTSVTSWFPAYHSRNAMSNLWLTFLGGLKDPRRFTTAMRIQMYGYSTTKAGRLGRTLTRVPAKLMKATDDFTVTLAGKKYKASKLYQEGLETGVLNRGWYGAELGKDITREIAVTTGVKPRLTEKAKYRDMARNITMELPRGAGTAVENNARFALFLDQLDKGIDIHSATRHTKKFLFDYGELCFDKETEILTNKGWKRWFDIQAGLKVLSFNLKKDYLEWNDINYIHIQDFNGELNYWHSTRFNAMITDKHKWIVYGDIGKKGNHNIIKRDKYSLVETNNIKRVKLKVQSCNYNNPIKEKIFSDTFVELIGWILTEGNYSHQGKSIQVYQSVVNKNKVDRLRKCWQKIQKEYQGTFTEYIFKRDNNIHSFYIGKDLAHKIIDMFPDKQLTVDFLLRLTNKQLRLLYEILMITDGTKHHKNNHEVFTQKGNDFAGVFQVLLFLIGKRSNCRKETRKGKVYNRVSIYTSKNVYVDEFKREKIKYNDKIWCVSSKNQTLVARRNGTIYLSGNTAFERKVMRRVVPFYTWLRKNLPLQIEQLFKQPGKFAAVRKTQAAFESLSEIPDERYLPDWMREREVFTRMPWERKDKPVYMNFDFAFQDLARLNLKDPGVIREWFSALHPGIKLAFEPLMNYSLFMGRDIIDPNLPEEKVFREALKKTLLGNLRIMGYTRRLTKEDATTFDAILDAILGLKQYSYDPIQQRRWYYRRKQKEQRALRKEQRRRIKKELEKRKK